MKLGKIGHNISKCDRKEMTCIKYGLLEKNNSKISKCGSDRLSNGKIIGENKVTECGTEKLSKEIEDGFGMTEIRAEAEKLVNKTECGKAGNQTQC